MLTVGRFYWLLLLLCLTDCWFESLPTNSFEGCFVSCLSVSNCTFSSLFLLHFIILCEYVYFFNWLCSIVLNCFQLFSIALLFLIYWTTKHFISCLDFRLCHGLVKLQTVFCMIICLLNFLFSMFLLLLGIVCVWFSSLHFCLCIN